MDHKVNSTIKIKGLVGLGLREEWPWISRQYCKPVLEAEAWETTAWSGEKQNLRLQSSC